MEEEEDPHTPHSKISEREPFVLCSTRIHQVLRVATREEASLRFAGPRLFAVLNGIYAPRLEDGTENDGAAWRVHEFRPIVDVDARFLDSIAERGRKIELGMRQHGIPDDRSTSPSVPIPE